MKRLVFTQPCTGLTARWCPVHGACSCPFDEMDDADCPLHAPTSRHPLVRTTTVLT